MAEGLVSIEPTTKAMQRVLSQPIDPEPPISGDGLPTNSFPFPNWSPEAGIEIRKSFP